MKEIKMDLNFMDFEIPLLQALVKLGGKAKPREVYPVEVLCLKELVKDFK